MPRDARLPFLFLVVLSILPSPLAAAAAPPPLGDVLRRVESLLAAGGGSPHQVEDAIALLAVAAPAPGEVPPAELLAHLSVQLQPLASTEVGGERRRQLVARAMATLEELSRKPAAARPPQLDAAAALPVPAHDACASAIALAPGVVEGTTAGATNDGGASCGASAAAPDVWYSYTAGSDGVVAWDTFGSALDTVLSLHSACPDAGGDHELACSDDAAGSLGSQVAREVTSGETVWVRVSGAGGASGSFALRTLASAGAVAGTVAKSSTGEPIAGATVQLFDSFGFFETSARTAEDGSYLFAGLSSGDWFLRAFHAGFITEIWEDELCPSVFSCFVEEVGDPVTVSTGLVEGIDFDLEPGGSIEGLVTEAETGDPLSTTVIAYDGDGNQVSSDFSDFTGLYRIGGLPPGSYTVRTSAFAHLDELYDDIPCPAPCDVTAGAPVAVAAGSTTPGIDFALRRLGSLAGRVTSVASGAPVPFVGVRAFDAEGVFVRSGFGGFDGEYTIDALAPGDYFVATSTFDWVDELFDDLPCELGCEVTTGTPVPVALGIETQGVDFALRALGRLAGSITAADSGGAIGADVTVFDAAGNPISSFGAFGSFDVGGFPPGTYFVTADTRFWDPAFEDQLFDGFGCDPGCDVTAGTPVVVAADATTSGVDFPLRRCALSSVRTVANVLLVGSQTVEACRTVRVGPAVTVGATGRLVVRAGRSVVFGDGFRILAGGRLTVAIDPGVGSP